MSLQAQACCSDHVVHDFRRDRPHTMKPLSQLAQTLLVVQIDRHGTVPREQFETCDHSQKMGPNAIKKQDGESTLLYRDFIRNPVGLHKSRIRPWWLLCAFFEAVNRRLPVRYRAMPPSQHLDES